MLTIGSVIHTTSEAAPGNCPVAVAPAPRRTGRAYRLLAATLLLRPLGNLCMAWGMKHFPELVSSNPLSYARAFVNPFVALGIAALVLGLLTRMALLSFADLSFVLPLTASGYIVSAVLGKLFLAEQVSSARWLGVILIFLGTSLVATTSRKSTAGARPPSSA